MDTPRRQTSPYQARQLGLYLSKYRHAHLQEWFKLKYGRTPSVKELRKAVRLVIYEAIDEVIIAEFEKHKPMRVKASSGETL